MRKCITGFLWAAALMTMLLFARPAAAQAAEDDAMQIWQVGVESLSVYPAPDSQLPASGTLNMNDICIVVDTMTDADGFLWGRVEEGTAGWIMLDKCVCSAELASCSDGPAAEPVYGALRIAHRGSHTNGETDNTVESFKQAGEEGFWGIESDLRVTTSGTLVVHHSSAADATCTFSEYLDICKEYGCTAIIDIKYMSGYKTYLPKAVDMVVKKGMLDQAIFQCSICDYLTYIRNYNSGAHLWILSGEEPTRKVNGTLVELMKAVELVGAEGVNLDLTYDYTAEYVEKLHAAGITVCTYLYNSSRTYAKYKNLYSDYRMANIPNP